ncbi:MAG: (2Fe-2S)-binding protein [Campylobacterota bacterium]|nr:(2Fe-2S)-binding protein [Campylobacterota bacterium]
MTHEEFKALDEDFEVCLCNGVILGEILTAVKNGHDTVEALMDETAAGTSCELCQSREIDEDEDRELHLDEILEFSKKG